VAQGRVTKPDSSILDPIRERSTFEFITMPRGIEWYPPRVMEKPGVLTIEEVFHASAVVLCAGRIRNPQNHREYFMLPAWFDFGSEDSDEIIRDGIQRCLEGIAMNLKQMAAGDDMDSKEEKMFKRVAEKMSREIDIAPELIFPKMKL